LRIRSALVAIAATTVLTFGVLPASASAPPVGPLPPGQVTTVNAKRGTLVAIALPAQSASSGLVWRLARGNPSIVRQIAERSVGPAVVVVYRTITPGTARVAYGLTKGETRKAYKSVTYKINVS
jgi:hypothetical protein